MISLLRRLLFAPLALAGVAVMTFLLIHLIPGDPTDLILGDQASLADRELLRQKLGLTDPLPEQFANYVSNLLQGNLGTSLYREQSVSALVGERLPATLELGLAALAIATIVGILLGVTAASQKNRLFDSMAKVFSLIGTSTPSFWFGPMLVFVFALTLDWLPVSERAGFDSLILPAITLSLGLAAVLAQVTRATVLDVLKEDYLRTAKAKGATRTSEIWCHALANAATPIVTVLGLQAGAVLTGTVIVESIFDWPGLGTLLLQSIHRRDYPLVQGCVLTIAGIYVVVNVLTEVLIVAINPRLRSQS